MKNVNDVYEFEEKNIDEQIKALYKQKAQIRRQKLLKCADCKLVKAIQRIDLFDQQYYVRPYGCMSGDYYTHCEYGFLCPRCKTYNRITPSLTDKVHAFVNSHRMSFKSVTQIYQRENGWHHEIVYVDKNGENKVLKHKKTVICDCS